MADKSNNLTEFLIGVANAIRDRRGYDSSKKINPQEFEEEIRSIPQASIEINFEAIKNISEVTNPQKGTIYLLFDIPGFIPENTPDISSIKQLFIDGEFDFRRGNVYEDNSVSLFSYVFGYTNYTNQYPINIDWLGQDMVGLVYKPTISKLVNVTNLNGNQLVCRVAIYDKKWYIIDYWRVQFGFTENLILDNYFDMSDILLQVDISHLLLDNYNSNDSGVINLTETLWFGDYFNITYNDNLYDRLYLRDALTKYEVNNEEV